MRNFSQSKPKHYLSSRKTATIVSVLMPYDCQTAVKLQSSRLMLVFLCLYILGIILSMFRGSFQNKSKLPLWMIFHILPLSL